MSRSSSRALHWTLQRPIANPHRILSTLPSSSQQLVDVNRLAKLAGLSLTDTEKQDLHTSIQTLINLVHPITTVHTAKDVEPLISLVADRNALILDAHSHGISETKQEKLRDQQDALITLTNEPFGHELLKQCHSKVDEFMYVVQQRG